jgi:hypothetical protein
MASPYPMEIAGSKICSSKTGSFDKKRPMPKNKIKE